MPLMEVADFLDDGFMREMALFQKKGYTTYLKGAFSEAVIMFFDGDYWEAFLELSIHYQEGAKKYGENNWQKGIPVRSYIDSAIRHYLKARSGYEDEPHERAVLWNIISALWTSNNKPELNDYKRGNNDD